MCLCIDNKNRTAFFEKLDFYRSNLKAARRVAVEGYLHAMEHHRAANLIDYVLRVSRLCVMGIEAVYIVCIVLVSLTWYLPQLLAQTVTTNSNPNHPYVDSALSPGL